MFKTFRPENCFANTFEFFQMHHSEFFWVPPHFGNTKFWIFTLNDADNARMKLNVGTVDDQSVLKYHISVAAKIAEGCKKGV